MVKLRNKYPLTLCSFLIKSRLITNEMKEYMDSYCVSVEFEHNLHDVLYMKYRKDDRIVKVIGYLTINPSLK